LLARPSPIDQRIPLLGNRVHDNLAAGWDLGGCNPWQFLLRVLLLLCVLSWHAVPIHFAA